MNAVRLESLNKNQTLLSATSAEYAAFVYRVFAPAFGDQVMPTYNKNNGVTTYVFLLPTSKARVQRMMTRAIITATVRALRAKSQRVVRGSLVA